MRPILYITLLGAILIASVSAQFANVTLASGIALPPTAAGLRRGSAWGDFNGDGFQDLLVAPGASLDVLLFLNNGNGTFTQQVALPASLVTHSPRMIAPADLDNDGDQDAYICIGQPGANLLLINQGNGVFTEEASGRGVAHQSDAFSAAFGDYDRDGWLDLYVGNRAGMPGQGNSAPNALFRSNGDGTFLDVTATSGTASPGSCFAAIWYDHDDDGWPDIAIANDKGANGQPPSALLKNMRDGTFVDVSPQINANAPIDGMGVCVGDFDNDGDRDMFQTNDIAGHVLFEWDAFSSEFILGPTWFSQAQAMGLTVAGSGWGCGFADYDNDGYLDLFIVIQGGSNRLYRSLSGTAFQDVSQQEGIAFCSPGDFSAMWVDFDNDGDLDLWDTGSYTAGQLGENTSATGNYLVLDCVGTISNRDAIGARVRVKTGSHTMQRVVRPNEGFLSSRDRRLHFGLSSETVVQQIEIRWPSGGVSYLENVAGNQFLTVVEPDLKVVAGLMTPGSVNVLNGAIGGTDAGLPFLSLLGVLPPIDLPAGSGRHIRVNPMDPVIPFSTTIGNPVFAGFAGVVGAGGFSPTLTIPAIPTLSGMRLLSLGVSFAPAYPMGIKTILGPRGLVIN